MQYTTIRGPQQRARCTDAIKGRLYCECGCQTPRDDDQQPELTGLVVSGRATQGYADYTLTRNGTRCGEINTQYCALALDGYEYIGCDREELRSLLDQIFVGGKSRFHGPVHAPAGDSIEETSARVRMGDTISAMEMDADHKGRIGYCTTCHSFCFGDCTASAE